MKIAQLLGEQAYDEMLVVKLLKKLLAQGRTVKVLLRNVRTRNRGGAGSPNRWTKLPDQEWLIQSVEDVQSALGTQVRIVNSSPERWFELQDGDEETLVLKNQGEYWLLTTKDGQGIAL